MEKKDTLRSMQNTCLLMARVNKDEMQHWKDIWTGLQWTKIALFKKCKELAAAALDEEDDRSRYSLTEQHSAYIYLFEEWDVKDEYLEWLKSKTVNP